MAGLLPTRGMGSAGAGGLSASGGMGSYSGATVISQYAQFRIGPAVSSGLVAGELVASGVDRLDQVAPNVVSGPLRGSRAITPRPIGAGIQAGMLRLKL